jgi:hypothetical protein
LNKNVLTQVGCWYRMLMIKISLEKSCEDTVEKLKWWGKNETEWCFVAMLLLERIIKGLNKSLSICKIERKIWKKKLENSTSTPTLPFKQQQNIAKSHFFPIITSFLEDDPELPKICRRTAAGIRFTGDVWIRFHYMTWHWGSPRRAKYEIFI